VSKSIFVALALVITTTTINAAPLITSAEAKQLGYCEGVYIYTAQLLQMQGNNGAAINVLSRASRVVAATMFLNRQGEVVPGNRLEAGKLARQSVKEQLDANPKLVVAASDNCDKAIAPLIGRASQTGETLWGKRFFELSQTILDQYKKQLGL